METMMAVEDGGGCSEDDDEKDDEEAMQEEEEDVYPAAASVPSTPTSLIPTIDQLFKRSFAHELDALAAGNLLQDTADLMRTSQVADQQLVILEDIHQILRDEANFELCV